MVVWMWMSLAFAQVDEWPCRSNPQLKARLEASDLALSMEQRGTAFDSTLFSGASSVLAPPRASEPRLEAYGDDRERFVAEHGAWTCTYGAPNLVDGDERTAWVEGAKGPGIGEVVIVPLPSPGPLEIRGGYGKSPALYQQNARPRRVEVVLIGQGLEERATQYPSWFGMPVLGRREVELKDVDGWQPLPLPAAGAPPESWAPSGSPHADRPVPEKQEPRYLAIRILSVYPGSKYEDTCISEVRGAKTP